MLLLEALAHKSKKPCTIINSPYFNGRQYRWRNGYIQTRTPTGQWHRNANTLTSILETAEVADEDVLGTEE